MNKCIRFQTILFGFLILNESITANPLQREQRCSPPLLARKDQFPHTVFVKLNSTGEILCRGTLIDLNWIVTTAKCLNNNTLTDVLLATTNEFREIVRKPKKVIVEKTNGLSLIEMDKPIGGASIELAADGRSENANNCVVSSFRVYANDYVRLVYWNAANVTKRLYGNGGSSWHLNDAICLGETPSAWNTIGRGAPLICNGRLYGIHSADTPMRFDNIVNHEKWIKRVTAGNDYYLSGTAVETENADSPGTGVHDVGTETTSGVTETDRSTTSRVTQTDTRPTSGGIETVETPHINTTIPICTPTLPALPFGESKGTTESRILPVAAGRENKEPGDAFVVAEPLSVDEMDGISYEPITAITGKTSDETSETEDGQFSNVTTVTAGPPAVETTTPGPQTPTTTGTPDETCETEEGQFSSVTMVTAGPPAVETTTPGPQTPTTTGTPDETYETESRILPVAAGRENKEPGDAFGVAEPLSVDEMDGISYEPITAMTGKTSAETSETEDGQFSNVTTVTAGPPAVETTTPGPQTPTTTGTPDETCETEDGVTADDESRETEDTVPVHVDTPPTTTTDDTTTTTTTTTITTTTTATFTTTIPTDTPNIDTTTTTASSHEPTQPSIPSTNIGNLSTSPEVDKTTTPQTDQPPVKTTIITESPTTSVTETSYVSSSRIISPHTLTVLFFIAYCNISV